MGVGAGERLAMLSLSVLETKPLEALVPLAAAVHDQEVDRLVAARTRDLALHPHQTLVRNLIDDMRRKQDARRIARQRANVRSDLDGGIALGLA